MLILSRTSSWRTLTHFYNMASISTSLNLETLASFVCTPPTATKSLCCYPSLRTLTNSQVEMHFHATKTSCYLLTISQTHSLLQVDKHFHATESCSLSFLCSLHDRPSLTPPTWHFYATKSSCFLLPLWRALTHFSKLMSISMWLNPYVDPLHCTVLVLFMTALTRSYFSNSNSFS